ncbi:CoA transferase [Pseudonocardia yunnanensis]|uniref:CaiB/BaiF CoA-transferase family protein n=1 Tax=Pseudonocardia yunnanensis TaxID=58107 RepID=A0ABW4F2R5_9PSEU
MSGPLTGIRVVDFSRVLSGPHCAQTLQDLGAEVIKVEPPSGDLSRQAIPGNGQISGYFAQQNAGKRNLSIDLNKPGSREAVLRLCDTADVIVENFRPGTLDSFGVGYADVAKRNPGVVYASISGYGQHGSWRARAAYAPTVEAEVGITDITARHFPESPLRTDSLSHADVYTGLHAAIAILGALHHKDRTGEGQYIDVAMAAVMLAMNERVSADASGVDVGAERVILGADDAQFFTGPDGTTFVSPMSLVGSAGFRFYQVAMRRPYLADDPRFRTPEDREQNLVALRQIVQDWILTFDDLESLSAQFDEAKIPTGQIRTTAEILETDWARQWTAKRETTDRAGGTITVPGRPWHFSGTKKPAAVEPARIPAFQGEHNTEILREIGYSDTEIAALSAAGALVAPGHPID